MEWVVAACLLIATFSIPVSEDFARQGLELHVEIEWCPGDVVQIRKQMKHGEKHVGAPEVTRWWKPLEPPKSPDSPAP